MANFLITTDYTPQSGGVAHYYHHLVAAFPGGLTVISDPKRLFASHGPLSWRQAISTVLTKVRAGDCLVVGQILPLGTAAWLASFFRSFDYYPVLHGLDFSLATRNAWKRFLTKRIISRSSGIICANSEVRRQLLALCPRAISIVVNPGLGPEEASPSPALTQELRARYSLDGKTLVLSLGRLVRRKGFDRSIEAISLLRQREGKYANLAYVIIGEGDDRLYLEALAKKEEVPAIFTGQVNEEEKKAWLSLCDVFLMPSRNIQGDFEGFGIVFLEAQSFGKPVIGGRSGGIADAIIDKETGLLADPEDAADIAVKLASVIDNPDFGRRLGEAGKERAAKDFSWHGLARRFHDFIRDNKRYGINHHSGI